MNDILIIGGGPAGLAIATALKEHDIPAILLESGDGPGHSWRNMPDNLRLGPWLSSQIDYSIPWHRLFRTPSAIEFADYLENYARKHELDIRPQTKVSLVKKTDRGYLVETDNGEKWETGCLVNATGYFHHPVSPEWVKDLDSLCRVIHYSDYRNPSNFSPYGDRLRILIVGGRVSAGELLVDLAGTCHELTLSTRHKILFDRPKWMQLLVAPLYFWLEDRKVAHTGPVQGSSIRNMEGGKTAKMIHSGRVRIIGPIVKAVGECVFHSEGSDSFDLILLATGWKSTLGHLPKYLLNENQEPLTRNMQSPVWPGMFFLGYDSLRSFRSRFLRGIREDALHLAAEIHKHLAAHHA